jgi:hypothetical protein
MPRIESFRLVAEMRLDRDRRADDRLRLQRSDELPGWDADSHLRAFREHEASRLLLAALGRRHGPLD